MKEMPAGSVGDINSTAKGSGARYNAGKAPLELIPLTVIAASYGYRAGCENEPPVAALHWLGRWQEDGDVGHLYEALQAYGTAGGWEECAKVLDYGRQKYAEWNWAKGMQWSIPLACAARHALKDIRGESHDDESKETHRGHFFANVVMLLTFQRTYPEGDDRPRCLA